MKDLVSNKLISDLFRLRSSIKFSLVSSLFKVGWAGVESHLQYPGLKEEKRVSRSHGTQQKGLPVASSFTGNPQNCSHLKLFLNYTGPHSLQRGSTEQSFANPFDQSSNPAAFNELGNQTCKMASISPL